MPWKTAKLCGADKVFCIKFQSEKELKKNKNIIDIVSKSISILCHELSNYELDGADYLLTLKTENIALLFQVLAKKAYHLPKYILLVLSLSFLLQCFQLFH